MFSSNNKKAILGLEKTGGDFAGAADLAPNRQHGAEFPQGYREESCHKS